MWRRVFPLGLMCTADGAANLSHTYIVLLKWVGIVMHTANPTACQTDETPLKAGIQFGSWNPSEFSRKGYGKCSDGEGVEFAYFCCDSPWCKACSTCSSRLTRYVYLNTSNHLLPCAQIFQPKLAAALLLQVEQMSLSCFAWSPAVALFYFEPCCLSGKKQGPGFVRFKWGISLSSWTAHCQMVNDLFFMGILENGIFFSKTDLQGFFCSA